MPKRDAGDATRGELLRWMVAWIVIGQIIYFGYGYSHSKLRKHNA